ncbi:MAG TPA: ribonuclease R [Tahibacter sp.]|uniref:ribonuclease R n=1 Tax=Tahibacter sp. TaxID=2056211 RepID=UPI002C138610|nr:ribonuclease R [Tahibacter sp.]HSX62646.1 ribonuclease R [Tahibacter sp.]
MKKTRTTNTPARAGAKKTARPGWMPEAGAAARSKRAAVSPTPVPTAPAAAGPKPSALRKMAAIAAAAESAKPRKAPAESAPARSRKQAADAATVKPRRGTGAAATVTADPFAERELQRYEHPIPSREALLAFLVEQGQLMNAEAIAKALSLTHERDFGALTKRLAAMLRDGQLIQNRRGGYGVAQKLDLVPGVVLANPDGYGFLKPDAGGEDLYLSPYEMRKVLHGDRVLGSIVGVDRRGRRQGAIVEVLERRSPRLVGRIVEQDGLVLVAPDDRRVHQDILIAPGKDLGARSGQIVVCEITEPPGLHRGPIGRVLAVLGERLTPSLIVEMAIASHDIRHEWPDAALREAAEVEPEVTAAEIAGRKDLRGVPLVTIDGEDARDFDDAVFAEPVSSGFRLVVAIADVSHYVQPESALDKEAYDRATSVYFPGFVVPMLPETLSNGICSLNPKVERLCMVCDMQVDHAGEVTKSKFYPAVMRSHARLTYNQVWKAIGEKDADARAQIGNLMPHIEHLYQLYKVLAKARKKRGAIDFESAEVKFRLAPSGEVVQLGAEPRNDAHKLIEECMIAANVQAALYLSKLRIPALYRVHEPPPEGKYQDLLEFLKDFSLKMPPATEVEPGDFAGLIKKIQKRPDASLIESVLLRSQSLAAYQPDCGGHFGLALDAYAHFTSPIRRYPDLLVHRAIRHALAKGKPSTYRYSPATMASMAVHCSSSGRRAEEAERDVDERYKCAWMEKHVGSEFDGIVSGVTSFGLFVELVDSKVTGLVHITQLPNDYYHFDPIRHLLTGERRGLKFRLGDPVRIQVLRASLEDRKIDFRLVADDHQEKKRR